jgi:hypothetical protein
MQDWPYKYGGKNSRRDAGVEEKAIQHHRKPADVQELGAQMIMSSCTGTSYLVLWRITQVISLGYLLGSAQKKLSGNSRNVLRKR